MLFDLISLSRLGAAVYGWQIIGFDLISDELADGVNFDEAVRYFFVSACPWIAAMKVASLTPFRMKPLHMMI